MIGVVAYFCPFVFTQKPPPPAAVIDFLCKARIQNFRINSISVRRAVERDCQTRAFSDLTLGKLKPRQWRNQVHFTGGQQGGKPCPRGGNSLMTS